MVLVIKMHEKGKTSNYAMGYDKEELMHRIDRYMKEEKPYLDQGFNQLDLAKALNSNRTYISEVINRMLKKNFIAYINEFKVQTAQKLLTEENYKRYTIDYIADQSGFRSRSAFYRAFKQITGLSPNAFIRKKRSA